MGRVPAAVLIAAWALIGSAFAQAPDAVLGTADGKYELFTPGEVVEAGSTEAASTYRFFRHIDVAAQATTSGDLPLTLQLFPATSFAGGLQTGAFHTSYEGSLGLDFTTGAASLTVEVATKHTFANGKSLTTRRSATDRVPSDGGDLPLSIFSSVTNLQPGPITFDDGSTGEITAALLAETVTVGSTIKISASAAETVKDVRFSSNAGVSMWQLRDPILAKGGSGTPTPLSDATPLVESGSGAAGSATAASRGDHVHPAAGGSGGAALSDNTPKPLGTAAAGTGDKASRDDHVHKRPDEIAANSAAVVTLQGELALRPRLQPTDGEAPQPPLAGGDVGDSDFASRDDHRHPPGSNGGAGSLPAFDGARKHLATNADDNAAEWVTPPPDLTDDVAANDNDIEALNFLTQDLIGGVPSTGWATVTDVSNVGIAVFTGAPSCDTARAATYHATITSGVGGKVSAVRVKAGFALANARVEVKGAGLTYEDLISGWSLLCTSSDGTFAYYHELYADGVVAWGAAVTSLAMQTTGGAHIGTSKYTGDPAKVERWSIVGNTTGIPISKTLPSITGHGGNALFVNSAATGLVWKSGGGGSSGGSTADIMARNRVILRSASSGSYLEMFSDVSYSETTTVHVTAWIWLGAGGEAVTSVTAAFFTRISDGTRTQCLTDIATNPSGELYAVSLATCTIPANTAVDIDVQANASGATSSGRLTWRAIAQMVPATVTTGGGGSSGPSIPSPTAAGKLQHLRVNAAGAAYELASPYGTAAPKPPAARAAVGTAETLARSDHVHALPTIPQGSTDTPEADSANGSAGTSNKWSPSDHSHPITDHDSVTWTQALVSTLTGGGASGGVMCDGSAGAPTAQACKALTDAFRRGDYNFFILRVARFDDNQNNEPVHVSGCSLFPGVPSAIFADDIVPEAACTANSGKNSANTFNQYDVFVKFGNTGNYIQVRLPNYNSYGVTNVTVTLTGVR